MTTMEGTSRSESNEIDDAFKVLAAEPRRVILRVLRDEGVVEVEDLIEALVAQNPEWKTSEPDCLLAALYHHHLPLLAEAGLVRYDDHGETVRYDGDRIVEEHLAVLEDRV